MRSIEDAAVRDDDEAEIDGTPETGPDGEDEQPDGPVVSDGTDTDMLLIDFR